MSDRRVAVLVYPTGQRVELDGLAASLVALVATTSLSPRSLSLLCQIVAHETTVAAIAYGMLEVDLVPTRAKIYHRAGMPRKPIGLQEDTSVA